MKASEFFSILCDQILTPVEGMTAEDFDKFPPLILSHLETVERADIIPECGNPTGVVITSESMVIILRSALRLKEMGDE